MRVLVLLWVPATAGIVIGVARSEVAVVVAVAVTTVVIEVALMAVFRLRGVSAREADARRMPSALSANSSGRGIGTMRRAAGAATVVAVAMVGASLALIATEGTSTTGVVVGFAGGVAMLVAGVALIQGP